MQRRQGQQPFTAGIGRAQGLDARLGEGIRTRLADCKVINMWPGLTSLQQKMMCKMNGMHADGDNEVRLTQHVTQVREVASRPGF